MFKWAKFNWNWISSFTLLSRFLRSGLVTNTRMRKQTQMARFQYQYNTNNLSIIHLSIYVWNSHKFNIFSFLYFCHSENTSFHFFFPQAHRLGGLETTICQAFKIFIENVFLLGLKHNSLTFVRNLTWSWTSTTAYYWCPYIPPDVLPIHPPHCHSSLK